MTVRIYRSEAQEGWMYDIYDEDLLDYVSDDEPEPKDGGHCTSSDFKIALQQAFGVAEDLINNRRTS